MPWNVEEELLTKKTNPKYPKEPKRNRIQELVAGRLLVTKEGDVGDAKGWLRLARTCPFAVAAVKQWEFKPFLLNREPIEVETTIKIDFTLAGAKPDPCLA